MIFIAGAVLAPRFRMVEIFYDAITAAALAGLLVVAVVVIEIVRD
jgi:hypothetical protein